MTTVSDVLIVSIADIMVIPIVIISLWVFLTLPKQVRIAKISKGLQAGLLALLFAQIITLFYHGERPFVALGLDPKASFLHNTGFPSFHALLVFAAVFVVWATTKRVGLSLALLGMALLVAIGRVIALVHSPVDILGGVICAFVAAVVVYGPGFLTFSARDDT